MLPKLGEHPVTSLDIKHPTVSIIVPEVINECISMLVRGWWFNEYDITLYPDNEGKIYLGTDALSFVPFVDNAAVRGTQLFDTDTLSYKWTVPVSGKITQNVDFDLLPEAVAQYVMYSALVSAYITDLGMTQDVQAWQAKAASAYTQVLAEHLRHRKYSTAKSGRFLRLRAAMRA